MKKVKSLYDLRVRAADDPAYLKLAIDAAKNLGGVDIVDLRSAMHWLDLNAMETDEEGVVGEVNFCRRK
jgi:hypothetical protein